MPEDTCETPDCGTPLMDRENIIEEIHAAAEEVFATMLGILVEPVPAYVAHSDLGSADGVMSLIGLAGPWTGAGSVICTPGCACHLASHLLMTEYEAVNHEVLDALAEITNMIIGSFKTLIEPRTGPLGLSIPSVVYGRNFTVRNGTAEEWTVIPFTCGEHRFEVRVCLAPSRDMVRPPAPLCA